MIRKNQRPFNFTDRQIARLQQIYCRLRTVNREANCQLRRIGCEILSDVQYRRAGKDLRALAIRMDSLVGYRQEILAAGRRQQPSLIELVITTSCQKCSENGRVPTYNDDENRERAAREALKQGPECQKQLDDLLALALRIDESQSCKFRCDPPVTFFAALKRLTGAGQRQYRCLQDTVPKSAARIEVLHQFEKCNSCGEVITDDDNQINTDQDLCGNYSNHHSINKGENHE